MALCRFVLPNAVHRRHLLSNALFPFEPIVAKHFDWMLGANVAVSAIHRIGGTVFIASPTIWFGMLRMYREFLCHLLGPPRGWKTRRAVAGFAPSVILSLLTPVERRLRQLASGFALLAPICRMRVASGQKKTPERLTRWGVSLSTSRLRSFQPQRGFPAPTTTTTYRLSIAFASRGVSPINN
jgi:hypothetical protein